MPRLVKGGKHVFGWSRVRDCGQILIPPEAVREYNLEDADGLVVLPGSRRSGGFGLSSREAIRRSFLEVVLEDHPELGEFRVPEGEVVEHEGRPYCWAALRQGTVRLPAETLAKYGVKTGDRLLVIRGSGLAVGFAVRGPIVEEARRHAELRVFGPGT
jgi:bifunctional DNA-binding transcriptional regulator/antitoxin component of YhaV-PrlF toxin-antitoxin module